MKAFMNEFFFISKQKRVRESVVMVRISVSVFLMLFCLAAMAFTAYAYYSCTVSSGVQLIQSANFDATIHIAAPDGTPVPLAPAEENKYHADLAADVPYTVTLTAEGTAETGFCVITADISEKVYHTQQLGIDRTAVNQHRDSITFILILEAPSRVTFFAHWGTSTYYDEYTRAENDAQYIVQETPPAEVRITADITPITTPIIPPETTSPPTEETSVPVTAPTTATQPPAETTVPTSTQTETTAPAETETTEPEASPPEETEGTESTEPKETEPTETESTEPAETTVTQPEETQPSSSPTEPENTAPPTDD